MCPAEAVEMLAARLSRPTRLALRKALNECYSSWTVTVDPGLPIAGLDCLGRALPAVVDETLRTFAFGELQRTVSEAMPQVLSPISVQFLYEHLNGAVRST